jgi:hypothetical protein
MDTGEFTAPAIQKLAVLINCLTVIGSELLARRGKMQQGYANLRKFRKENKELLDEVHSLSLKYNATSALRVSEDLEQPPMDASKILGLVQQCLTASVFISHCIATSGKGVSLAPSEQAAERRLH